MGGVRAGRACPPRCRARRRVGSSSPRGQRPRTSRWPTRRRGAASPPRTIIPQTALPWCQRRVRSLFPLLCVSPRVALSPAPSAIPQLSLSLSHVHCVHLALQVRRHPSRAWWMAQWRRRLETWLLPRRRRRRRARRGTHRPTTPAAKCVTPLPSLSSSRGWPTTIVTLG
jgi:hypothetical protein